MRLLLLVAMTILPVNDAAAHAGHHGPAGAGADPSAAPSPAPVPPAPDVGPAARARAYFPDVPLVSHENASLRFYSDLLRDNVVVIDFIFTRCDGACPLLTARLNQVRKQLGPLLGTEVVFVSISVDPEFDTPAELARFARAQNAAHPGWTFVTGKKDDIEAIVKKLGQYSPGVEEHSTAMIAGNARRNHWVKIHPSWAPAAIAEQVRRLVEEQRSTSASAAYVERN